MKYLVSIFRPHSHLAWKSKDPVPGGTISTGVLISQPISHRPPIATARVRRHVRSYRICDGQSGTGAGFLQVLPFPLHILIPPNAPYSSIIWVWYKKPNYWPT
jgi:hypothetical protein